jgi:hypothetical protein
LSPYPSGSSNPLEYHHQVPSDSFHPVPTNGSSSNTSHLGSSRSNNQSTGSGAMLWGQYNQRPSSSATTLGTDSRSTTPQTSTSESLEQNTAQLWQQISAQVHASRSSWDQHINATQNPERTSSSSNPFSSLRIIPLKHKKKHGNVSITPVQVIQVPQNVLQRQSTSSSTTTNTTTTTTTTNVNGRRYTDFHHAQCVFFFYVGISITDF